MDRCLFLLLNRGVRVRYKYIYKSSGGWGRRIVGWGIIGKGIRVSSGSLIILRGNIHSATCAFSFVSVLAPRHYFLSFPLFCYFFFSFAGFFPV